MKRVLKVKCPTCRKEGEWFEGGYGPFCSDRCRLVDLGKWLNEEPRISEPLRPDHFAGFENVPAGLDPDRPEESS
jgi:uncharacterized protein